MKHTVTEVTLKNGAKGLIIDVPDAPIFGMDFQFRAGIRHAPDVSKSQVAHILEHMSFGKTSLHDSPEDYDRDLTKNGAYSDAATGYETIEYSIFCPQMDWKRVLELQRVALTEPIFTEESLSAEKGNVYDELRSDANANSRVLFQEIMRAAHVCTWYDPDELKTVDSVTLEDIQNHYKKTFTSDNLRFVLAGDIGDNVQEVVDQLEKWVLPRGERFEYEKLVARAGGLVCIPKTDMTDIEFQFSIFLNRRLHYQECVALGLLRHALTQTYFSRIYGVARKRGICYAMGSDFETYLPSLSRFDFDGDLSHEHAPELFELIVKEMKRVASDGITPLELEDAKQFRLGRHQMDIAHSAALAHWYASDYFEDETIDGPDKMVDYINNVTSDMIVALVNEFLDGKLWCLGVIGDTSHDQAQSYYDQLAKLFEER